MKSIKLLKITLINFMGVRSFCLMPDGKSASCWVFEYLCISSMNNIVFTPVLSADFACSTASLMSFTPEDTADISIKCAFVWVEISLARVVFPHPGVPHKISENSRFVFNKFNKGLFWATTLLCPKKSSRLLGRSSSANGTCLF